MANDSTLTFACPACLIRLTVPSHLAGISGPCPSCRKQIQAPSDRFGEAALAPTSASVLRPEVAVAGAIPEGGEKEFRSTSAVRTQATIAARPARILVQLLFILMTVAVGFAIIEIFSK